MPIEITRGFKHVTENLKKKGKYVRHCNNCNFYYANKYEKEEFCQNEKVTQYDIVIDGATCYCSYWQPPTIHKEEKVEKNDYLSRFKKSYKGRG